MPGWSDAQQGRLRVVERLLAAARERLTERGAVGGDLWAALDGLLDEMTAGPPPWPT